MTAIRDPAYYYQRAEQALCNCGAAGSGEGHADWCEWQDSEWRVWGDALDKRPFFAAAVSFLRSPHLHKITIDGVRMSAADVADALSN